MPLNPKKYLQSQAQEFVDDFHQQQLFEKQPQDQIGTALDQDESFQKEDWRRGLQLGEYSDELMDFKDQRMQDDDEKLSHQDLRNKKHLKEMENQLQNQNQAVNEQIEEDEQIIDIDDDLEQNIDIPQNSSIDPQDSPIEISQGVNGPQNDFLITENDTRRRQTQSIDMFDQMLSKFMKTNPSQLNKSFLNKFRRSNKSRSYLIMGFGYVKLSQNQEFINIFKSSIKYQIAYRRIKISQKVNYSSGLKYLLNLEFNYVQKALELFFDEMDYGRAIQAVYINERQPQTLPIKTRSEIKKTCVRFQNQFGWPAHSSF